MTSSVTVRPTIRRATEADLPAIVRIYNQAIVSSVATFDLEPYAVEARREWFDQFGDEHPMFVAEAEGNVVGFAYYLPYRAKAAYARTKETTIYVDTGFHRRGVGRALYEALIEHARRGGVHVLMAVLGGRNPASEALHRALGFEQVGHYREVGRKFGGWVDTYTFQKIL